GWPGPTVVAECGGPPAVAPARPETGGGLAPDPSATRPADVYASWSSRTRTSTLANSAGMIHAGLPEGHGEPDDVQRGRGVGLGAERAGAGGPALLGPGAAPAVARGQAESRATRDPPGRNPGGSGAAGGRRGVTGLHARPAGFRCLSVRLSRKVQIVQRPSTW